MSDTTKQENSSILRNLPFEAVRATEAAAIAAHSLFGMGDEKAADQLAVDAMRKSLNELPICGTVAIGEGERDKAPMLYIGEKVGTGLGPELDIALDPLEGTTILATGGRDSLSVLAIAGKGGFLHAPDVYMDKVAVGFSFPETIIDLDNSPAANLRNIAKAKKCDVSELSVVILSRLRHEELIAKVREAGSRIILIQDGDVAAVISTTMRTSGVDVYMGIGGSPEGVLAAAALRAIGGQICTRLLFETEEEKERARKMGIKDFSRQYRVDDLAKGDVVFAATGVTDGALLSGVRIIPAQNYVTHSIVMCSKTGMVRKIETYRAL